MLVSFVFLGQQIAQIGHNEYLCSFYLCFWVNILRKQDIMNMMQDREDIANATYKKLWALLVFRYQIKTKFTVHRFIDFMVFYFATGRIVPCCSLVNKRLSFVFVSDIEQVMSDQQY